MNQEVPKGKVLEWIPELKISPKGVFKYIVIRVAVNGSPNALIVRGDTAFSYHSENFVAIKKELKELGLKNVKGN